MARDTAKADKPLSTRMLVEIDRDMTAKTPKVIWKHEFPILEAIFGEGKVKEIDPKTMDDGYTAKVSPALLPWNKKQEPRPRPSDSAGIGFIFTGDPRSEYDRLAAAYGKLPDENILAVEKVYGRFQDGKFTSIVAGGDFDDMPDAQLRSLLESYGLAPTGGNKDMSDADKAEAATARETYLNATRADLLKACKDGGVQLA